MSHSSQDKLVLPNPNASGEEKSLNQLIDDHTLQPSGVELLVCMDVARRQRHGIAKYGTTVIGNKADLREWLNHAYEEALDMAVYLKRAIIEIDKGAINPRMTPTTEEVAKSLYEKYCASVGGRAFNGDALPTWEVFYADPSKTLQSTAWINVASQAKELLK